MLTKSLSPVVMIILIGGLKNFWKWAKNIQTRQKVNLKGDQSLDTLYSKLWEKIKVLWTPKESGYLMEPIEVKDELRRGVNNIKKKNGQKRWF